MDLEVYFTWMGMINQNDGAFLSMVALSVLAEKYHIQGWPLIIMIQLSLQTITWPIFPEENSAVEF